LRYQVKIHTISNKPRRKSPSNSPQNTLFLLLLLLKKINKTCNMEMTSYAKVRSHM